MKGVFSVDEGWRKYEVQMAEQGPSPDGKHMTIRLELVPGSVVFNRWHPRFWLAVAYGTAVVLIRRLRRN